MRPTKRLLPRTHAVVGRLPRRRHVLVGKTATPEFGWKALTDSPMQGTTRSPWNLKHSPGGSSGGASALTAAGINPFNHGNDGGGSMRIPAAHTGLVGLKPILRPHRPVPRRLALRRRDQPGRARPLGARHRARAERHRRLRPARLALAAERGARLHGRPRGRRARLAHRPQPGLRPCRRPIPKCATWSRRPRRRFEEAGAPCRGCRPADRAAENSFAPLWSGSFAVRLRQIPTQLHGKLDPGFRALAEKGLAITLCRLRQGLRGEVQARARSGPLGTQKFDLLLAPGDADRRRRRSTRSTIPTPSRAGPRVRPTRCRATSPASPPPRCLPASHRPACRSDSKSSGRPAPTTWCCAPCVPTRAPPAGPGRRPGCWRRWPGSELHFNVKRLPFSTPLRCRTRQQGDETCN